MPPGEHLTTQRFDRQHRARHKGHPMIPQLDVGKLVGAASAPVALIIATSICLGNLGAKYGMLAGIFRDCTREYRALEDREGLRCRSLEHQMEHYSSRL